MANDVGKTLNLMFNPLASVVGSASRPGWAPQLSTDKGTDAALWNAILGAATYGGLGFAVKKLMNQQNLEKWRKDRKKIVRNKVNSIMPEASPNIDIDDLTSEEAARDKGLDDTIEKEASMPKYASLADYLLWAPLPVLSAIGAYLGGTAIANDDDVDTRAEELDSVNKEKRNQLSKLHGQIMELKYGKPVMQKAAAGAPEYVPQGGIASYVTGDDTRRGALGMYTAATASAIGILSLMSMIGAYKYTKSKDKNDKSYKALKELSARNLTNIPENVQIDFKAVDDAKKRAKQLKEIAQVEYNGTAPQEFAGKAADALFQ